LGFLFRTLVRLLHVSPGFFESSEGVVVGLQGLPVFVDSTLPLAGDIEDFSQLNTTPDFGPARITIAVLSFAALAAAVTTLTRTAPQDLSPAGPGRP